jgi:hypothetical protein
MAVAGQEDPEHGWPDGISHATGARSPGLGLRFKETWPQIRLATIQMTLAAVIATVICVAIGHPIPWFAPLVAITLVQVLCAPHRRGLWLFLFGQVNGALFGTMFNPAWSTTAAAIDALVGAVVAIVVAVATAPRRPARQINEAVEPLLTRMATNIRAIAAALRAHDPPAAGAAVYALNDTDADLIRLHEVLLQARRSSLLTHWHSGDDLTELTTAAREISYAVRDIRTLARHAWWGVLRAEEPVPAALPQMLDALADGIAVLRDELRDNGQPLEARPLLISAARWIDVMRAEPLSISAATVAASANAAVLELLTAIGVPVNDADQLMRRVA